jgi:hypothetical protein
MRILRLLLALLIAPLVVPFAGCVLYAAHTGKVTPFYAALFIFKYTAYYAYAATFIIGLPAFLILNYVRLNGKLASILVGAILSFSISFVLFSLVPGFFTARNTEGYIVNTLTGAAGGLLFWMIARGGISSD